MALSRPDWIAAPGAAPRSFAKPLAVEYARTRLPEIAGSSFQKKFTDEEFTQTRRCCTATWSPMKIELIIWFGCESFKTKLVDSCVSYRSRFIRRARRFPSFPAQARATA